MELDELKNVWVSVDEQLKKQEILKKRIIKEMICKKTDKSLKQLFWSDSISIPILLLVIPFIVYVYVKSGGIHIIWDVTVIFAGIFCIVYLPFLVYRVYELIKIDLSENLRNNLYYINHYAIHIKREKIIMNFIGPLLLILVSLTFIEIKTDDIFFWIFWVCICIFLTLYSYWSYNKFYNKNIQSIKKSLEELKELEEE